MSGTLWFVSNRAFLHPTYPNPHTPEGVDLTTVNALIAGSFDCHEVGLQSTSVDWNYAGVVSPFWRIYFNPKPGNAIRSGGETYGLGPDRVVLVPEFCAFDCLGVRRVPHLWIHFSFAPHVLFCFERPVAIAVDKVMKSLLKELVNALAVRKRAVQELGHLSFALVHLAVGALPHEARKVPPPRFRELLGFIAAEQGKKLTNGLLAQRTGRSVGAFCRWFRAHMEISPGEYVNAVRLQTAARLLAFGEDSIEHIAEVCGFPNRHYFSRVFARRFKIGPAGFRQRSRTQPS